MPLAAKYTCCPKISCTLLLYFFQRFFEQVVLKPKQIGELMLRLAAKPGQGWVLAMDRTN